MIDAPLLDAVLMEIITRWDIPGLGVGIVENGRVVYARGFGVQSLDTAIPVTPDSLFCVASVSKCFVATAVMQLVEQGNLELDRPLVEYLPEFCLDDDRHRQITPRQMLSHTSGMPDMDEDEYDALVATPEYDDDAAARYVRSLAGRKMVAAPGERFAYSNIAYNVLGHLISRLTGLSFEASIKTSLLVPAGMPDSTFFFPHVPRQRLAVPHLRSPELIVNPVYPYHRADAPASFLHSSVLEMCQWAITCLNDANNHGQRILSPAGFELMWTPVVEWGFPPLYEHCGLGWTLGHYEGVKTVSHGGMGFGWSDFLTLLPERNCGAVILCNDESWARSRTVRAVIHAMLDMPPVVGAVSWSVPLLQAYQAGGIAAMHARYGEIKDDPDTTFDADDFIPLAYQLQSLKKDLVAIDLLDFNLHIHPDHVDSLVFLGRLHARQGNAARAGEAFRKALALDPGNASAAAGLGQVL